MLDWNGFFMAQVGASAALTGLIFVSVSLNLSKILDLPGLPGRAAEALIALASVLVISTLMLVPGQTLRMIGIEILGAGILIWGTETFSLINRLRTMDRKYFRSFLLISGLSQSSTIPLIVAGAVTLLAGSGGLYWIVPGFLFSYALALLDAWVLLIEINR